jgi:hypothetical protein
LIIEAATTVFYMAQAKNLYSLTISLMAIAGVSVGEAATWPVIGILSVPTHYQWDGEPGSASPQLGSYGEDYRCYVPAGYVKMVGKQRMI